MLLEKPSLIIGNKMDLPNSKDNLLEFKKNIKNKIIPISTFNTQTLYPLCNTLKTFFNKI